MRRSPTYKLTEEQYNLLNQKRKQFETFSQSGYATGLDITWKTEAGKVYTLLTGQVANLGCGDCVGRWLPILYGAVKAYEADNANIEEPAEPGPVSPTFVAVDIIDTGNPSVKQVVHFDPPAPVVESAAPVIEPAPTPEPVAPVETKANNTGKSNQPRRTGRR